METGPILVLERSCRTPPRMPRRLLRALIGCIVAITFMPGPAAAATPTPADGTSAEWTFWRGAGGAWVPSTMSPSSTSVVEGSVVGWRYGSSKPPTLSARFADHCDGSFQSGTSWSTAVQVAVIVDVQPDDVPPGQTAPEAMISCMPMPQLSDAADALIAARLRAIQEGVIHGTTPERQQLGLPNDGAVNASTPLPPSDAGAELPAWLPWVLGGAVFAIIAGVLVVRRRRGGPVR